MKIRCNWCEDTFDDYVTYHDTEWGVPVFEDKKHFEFLILESAQAGLSWATILKKRKGYREAFAHFDVQQVAAFPEDKVSDLMLNPKIIRNEKKINAAINNAQKFIEIQNEFGSFSAFIWQFVHDKPIINQWKTTNEMPAHSKESDLLAKELKKKGFKFIGTTIMYSHMQAMGLVNDHTTDCFRYRELL